MITNHLLISYRISHGRCMCFLNANAGGFGVDLWSQPSRRFNSEQIVVIMLAWPESDTWISVDKTLKATFRR